jgi:hypothetical protein
MNQPETESPACQSTASDDHELICRCDLRETTCTQLHEKGECSYTDCRLRTASEIEAADTKRENSLLPVIFNLAPEASGKIPETPELDECANYGENGDSDFAPFPVSALPPMLRHIAEEAAAAERVPVALTAAAAIATASAAIGAGLVLKTGPHRLTHANLFILAAAQSGTGKGRAFALVARTLQEMERDKIDKWRKHEKPNLEARLRVTKKAVEGLEKKAEKANAFEREEITAQLEPLNRLMDSLTTELREPLWTVADVTREALADALSRGTLEALASMSPEARGVVDVLGGRYRSGSSDEDIYLSAFSVESFTVHRIGRPATHLAAPCLTVFWMIQPDALRAMFSKDAFTESGLLPRFLAFDSKAQPEFVPDEPHVMHPAASRDWRSLLEQLADTFHERGDETPAIVELSPEAAKGFRDFENQTTEDRRTGGHLADVSSYAARWAENAQRLALVLHASEYGSKAASEPLSVATAADAVEIIAWFIREQMAILRVGRERGKTDRLRRLETILLNCPSHEMSLRDLDKSHNITRSEIESLVHENSDRLTIEERKPSGPGRPSTVLRLILSNPIAKP